MSTHANQIATLSIYQFDQHKFWAFKQMRLGYGQLQGTSGLQFHKIMGTGAGNGFSIYPNFGQYAILCVWDDEESASAYFQNHPYQRFYRERAKTRQSYVLRPVHGHGQWDGVEPFQYQKPLDLPSQWAVVTRATISASRLLEFWKHVPSVSRSIENQPGLQLSVGIGEWPLIQQATFSVWQSLDAMKAYAYQSKLHKEAITKTRDRAWYREEMFARFQVLNTIG